MCSKWTWSYCSNCINLKIIISAWPYSIPLRFQCYYILLLQHDTLATCCIFARCYISYMTPSLPPNFKYMFATVAACFSRSVSGVNSWPLVIEPHGVNFWYTVATVCNSWYMFYQGNLRGSTSNPWLLNPLIPNFAT